jgi:hypothetical protein
MPLGRQEAIALLRGVASACRRPAFHPHSASEGSSRKRLRNGARQSSDTPRGAQAPWTLRHTVCWAGASHPGGGAPAGGVSAAGMVTLAPGERGARNTTRAHAERPASKARCGLSPWARRPRDPAHSLRLARCTRVLPARLDHTGSSGRAAGLGAHSPSSPPGRTPGRDGGLRQARCCHAARNARTTRARPGDTIRSNRAAGGEA